MVLVQMCRTQHGDPADSTCMCLTSTGVNVRGSACGEVIGSATSPSCYVYAGNMERCILSGDTYDFYQVNYCPEGSTGWIAGTYLAIENDDTKCTGPEGTWPWQPGTCSAVQIVTRAEWGARPADCVTKQNNPVNYMFIHHTAGASCDTQAECSAQVRAVQNLHMDSNGWCDIGYTWLVGEDGRGYEGTTPENVGTHTGGYNSVGHAICTIGTFTNYRPNDLAMIAVQHIIDCALNRGYLASTFKLNGHRDTSATACPGDSYYPEIQTWPYYCFDAPSASNPGATCTRRPTLKLIGA